MATKLLPHNIPVFNEFCSTVDAHNKAMIITFTGGGKTFLTSRFLEVYDIHNALLVTSNINSCRDWEALTDRITAITYHRWGKTPVEQLLKYDAVILDEVHHVGAPVWGKKLNEFLAQYDPAKIKLIGLTADDIRWSDGGRSMSQEYFPDCTVRGYNVKEAIENDIIPPFTYISAFAELEQKTAALQAKARKAGIVIDHLISKLQYIDENIASVGNILKKYAPVRKKGIVFVDKISDIPDAERMLETAFPGMQHFVLHSKQSKQLNAKIRSEFDDADEGFLFNVNMLAESAHIPGVNMLVMNRRTQSPTVFFQQLGRGIAVNGPSDLMVFDIVGNKHMLKVTAASHRELMKMLEPAVETNSKMPKQIIVHDFASPAIDILTEIENMLSDSKPWTPEEDDVIRREYPTRGVACVDKLPGRTTQSIATRANRLGIKYTMNRWTPEEDDIIRREYPTRGVACVDKLPGRATKSIAARANALGVKYNMNRWTPEEDDIIRREYPTRGVACVDKLPGRTTHSITTRAHSLGVKKFNAWTSKEDDIIRQEYPTRGVACVDKLPGRNEKDVSYRATKLGVKKHNAWTPKEDDIIRREYPIIGIACADKLPGRNKKAVSYRAIKLGLKHIDANKWTPEEDNILQREYPTRGTDCVDKLPGRNKRAIKYRAKKLGIKYLGAKGPKPKKKGDDATCQSL